MSRTTRSDIWSAPPASYELGEARSVDDLRATLRALQQRLGTPAERPEDFNAARAIAHAINNRIQIDYLRQLIGAAPRTSSTSRLVA